MSRISFPLLIAALLPALGLGQAPAEKLWPQTDIIAAAAADLRSLTTGQNFSVRYLDLGNIPAKERPAKLQMYQGHVHGLSREIARAPLVVVPGTDGALVRLALENYGWPADVWEQLAEVDPWFHVQIEEQRIEIAPLAGKKNLGSIGGTWAVGFLLGDDGQLTITDETVSGSPVAATGTWSMAGKTLTMQTAKSEFTGTIIGNEVRGKRVFNGQTGTFFLNLALRKIVVKAGAQRAEFSPVLVLDPKDKANLDYLALTTGSKAPVVRADWFQNQTAIQEGRKPGYYDFLGIKAQAGYEKLIRFAATLAKDLEHRRVIIFSGITLQPRRIDRVNTVLGGLWRSSDNVKAVGKANPLQALNGDFTFNVTEQIGPLPNGWPGFYLGNNKGERQDKAPDNVVKHYGALHVNLSCLECHMRGADENMIKSLDAVKLAKLESPD